MGAWVTSAEQRLGQDEIGQLLARHGTPRWWSNGPDEVYAPHSHGYHKVLYCVTGTIIFHVDGEDLMLSAGDRLDVEAGTEHAATVGPDGVQCGEAAVGD
jgi:uncharacterized protein YjlB